MNYALASWPGLLDADPTILGALVAVVAGLAAAHLVRRMWPSRRARRAAGGAV